MVERNSRTLDSFVSVGGMERRRKEKFRRGEDCLARRLSQNLVKVPLYFESDNCQ